MGDRAYPTRAGGEVARVVHSLPGIQLVPTHASFPALPPSLPRHLPTSHTRVTQPPLPPPPSSPPRLPLGPLCNPTMVRLLSFVALAAATVAAAVAAPATAVPAAASLPAMAPAALDAAAEAVDGLRGVVAVRPPGLAGKAALVLRSLRPMWAAFQAGKFDPMMAAFKAGKMDASIPSQAEVMKKVDAVVLKIRMVVPKVFQVMANFKAGKYDACLAAAKKSTLEEFLMSIAAKMYPIAMPY